MQGEDSDGNAIFNLGEQGNNIAGWTIHNDKIFTGTDEDVSGYTSQGGRFIISSSGAIHAPGFYVTKLGKASFSGSVSASEGNIGGWTINDGDLSSTNIKIESTNQRIYIKNATHGQPGIQMDYNSGNPRFHVGSTTTGLNFDGTDLSITSSKVDISGSDVKLITPSFLFGDKDSAYISSSNSALKISSSKFHLDGGTAIFGGDLSAAGGTFSGNLVAVGGYFSGSVSASSGNISGWAMYKEKFSRDFIELNSASSSLIVQDSIGNEKVRVGSGSLSSVDGVATTLFSNGGFEEDSSGEFLDLENWNLKTNIDLHNNDNYLWDDGIVKVNVTSSDAAVGTKHFEVFVHHETVAGGDSG